MIGGLPLELNAVGAIAARDFIRGFRSPTFVVINLIVPIILMGILGGSIAQNLGEGLAFDYMLFVLVGMIVNGIYQGAVTGITALVEERERSFTQTIMIAPISRYSILLGKMIGAGVGGVAAVPGFLVVALLMGIHLEIAGLVRLLLFAPVTCLAGGSLGVIFVGFVRDPRAADMGSLLLVFPQLFVSGALIPVRASGGVLGFMAHAMPLTYPIDLGRNAYYWDSPVRGSIVLNDPAVDLAVTLASTLAFVVIGTRLFVRTERRR